MTRILSAGLAWLLFVGGVTLYMTARNTPPDIQTKWPAEAPATAPNRVDLELTLTFDAAPDPFALTTGDNAAPPVVVVRINGQTAVTLQEGPSPGVPRRVEGIEGVTDGASEVYVEATPPLAAAGQQAVRVRIFADQRVLADRTFWSEGGGKVTGTFPFETGPATHGEDHDDR